MWIGASDSASKGAWVWDGSGKKLSPGYQGWMPGYPKSTCKFASNYDCAVYYWDYCPQCIISLPRWYDLECTNNYGGICELQPSNLSTIELIQ